MKLKGLIDEDCINYKEKCMTLEFPICKGFKCDKFNGKQVCQNSTLATQPDIDISVYDIIERYINNPITTAMCFQGLEPLDTIEDVMAIIGVLRMKYKRNDPVIIYTGYNKEEITNILYFLKSFPNIIVKFGRFIANRPSRFDNVLGVTLASDNQYAEVIS